MPFAPLRTDRVTAAAGSALLVALLGYALLVGLAVGLRRGVDPAFKLLDLQPPRPTPTPPPRPPPPRLRPASRPASAANLRNKATDIVAPPPVVPLPVPVEIVAAAKPGAGTAPDTGASNRPGPGEGAGGQGDGDGRGGDGSGDGGGNRPPRFLKGRLKFSDLPAALRDAGIGGTVAVRYHVERDGRVGDCIITASSGSAELDALTCRLIEQRFRFDPSRDREGRRVRSTIVENHGWIVAPAPEDIQR